MLHQQDPINLSSYMRHTAGSQGINHVRSFARMMTSVDEGVQNDGTEEALLSLQGEVAVLREAMHTLSGQVGLLTKSLLQQQHQHQSIGTASDETRV